jgi:hypothetical protein
MVQSLFQWLALGTTVSLVYQYLKDRADRRVRIRASILELTGKLDDILRSMKQIKRELRANSLTQSTLDPAQDDPAAYSIPANLFDDRLAQLSRIQLSVEEIRQTVRVRVDLFPQGRIDRLFDLLSYVDKYLGRIVDDYEHRRIGLAESMRVVNAQCPHMFDFLARRWRDPNVDPMFNRLNAAATGEAAFKVIAEIRAAARLHFPRLEDRGEPRTKRISDACLRAALWEMREEVAMREQAFWMALAPRGLRRRLPPPSDEEDPSARPDPTSPCPSPTHGKPAGTSP